MNNRPSRAKWRLSSTNTNSCDIPTTGINHIKGAFLHSAGTAPIITLFIPGTPLKTTHPQKDA